MLYLSVAIAVLLLTAPAHIRRTPGSAALAVALCLLLALGQARPSQAMYPFQHWSMYSAQTFPVTFQEYIVVGSDGHSAHYPFTVIAFSSPRAFMARIEALVTRCRCKEEDRVLDALIEALVAIDGWENERDLVEFRIVDVNWTSGSRTLRYRWRRGIPE